MINNIICIVIGIEIYTSEE